MSRFPIALLLSLILTSLIVSPLPAQPPTPVTFDYNFGSRHHSDNFPLDHQIVKFEERRKESTGNTWYSTDITWEDSFFINPNLSYAGDVEWDGKADCLWFTGEVKLHNGTEEMNQFQFELKGEQVCPDSGANLLFPVHVHLRDRKVGLFQSVNHKHLYHTYFDRTWESEDIALWTPETALEVSDIPGSFRVGDWDRLQGRSQTGAFMSHSWSDGKGNRPPEIALHAGEASGLFQLGEGIGIKAAGSWYFLGDQKTMSGTNLMLGIDFPKLPPKAWEALGDHYQIMTSFFDPLPWRDPYFYGGLGEFWEEGKAEKKMAAYQDHLQKVTQGAIVESVDIASELPYELLLSHVDLHYEPEYHALVGNQPIGIIGIGGETIGRASDSNSKIEYSFGRQGSDGTVEPDTLQLYLEVDELTFFYCRMYDGTVEINSSSLSQFSEPVKQWLERHKGRSMVSLVDEDQKDDFLTRYVMRYIWRE